MLIYTCTDGYQGTTTVGSLNPQTVPSCSNGGAWIDVLVQTDVVIERPEPFDPAHIDAETATEAAGAGFVVLGVGLLLVLAVKAIIRLVRTA